MQTGRSGSVRETETAPISEKERFMSFIQMLIIGGWSSTGALIGFYALKESGTLLKIRVRLAEWLLSSQPTNSRQASVS
jgi:hypothetical protein